MDPTSSTTSPTEEFGSSSHSMHPPSATSTSNHSSTKEKVALPRGEACLQCRRRKLRCDAVKPACSKCIKSGRGESCEYQDTHYLVTIHSLEDQVRVLQDRLTQFEGGGAHMHPHMMMAGGMFTPGFTPAEDGRLPTSLPFSSFLGGDPSSAPFMSTASPALSMLTPGSVSSVASSQRSYSAASILTLSSAHSPSSSGSGYFGSLPRTMSSSSSLQAINERAATVSPPASDPASLISGFGVTEPPAPLGPSTVGSSASRSLLRTFASHAARFGFPQHSLERLPHVAPALLETIYAIACRMGGSGSLSLAYDVDARALERSFIHRAEIALSRQDDGGNPFVHLELVQAQALLANLMYIIDRPMDGHRHAGAAMRLAMTLQLHHTSIADERAETWWMVYAVDRAWSSVYGVSPTTLDESTITAPFPGAVPIPDASFDRPPLVPSLASALDLLYVPPTFGIAVPDPARGGLLGAGETLGAARFKVLALHARTAELLASFSLGRPLPQAILAHAGTGLDPFSATIAALERLIAGIAMIPRGPASATVRLEAHASIVSLHMVMSNSDAAVLAARAAVAEVGGLIASEVDMLDPVVAYSIATIQRAWRDLGCDLVEIGPLDRALDRMAEVLPYIAPHRSSLNISGGTLNPMEMGNANSSFDTASVSSGSTGCADPILGPASPVSSLSPMSTVAPHMMQLPF